MAVNRISLQNLVRRNYDAASMQELARLLENSVNKLAEGGTVTLGTAVASTSGTSIDFTGIPPWVTQIIIQFVGVSTNGTSIKQIQIGDSGGIETSGYLGTSSFVASVAASEANYTAGFGVHSGGAADTLHGSIVLTLENASNFTWVASGMLGHSEAAGMVITGGSKSLSAALDRVRITTVGGTDTFDAGAINIRMA